MKYEHSDPPLFTAPLTYHESMICDSQIFIDLDSEEPTFVKPLIQLDSSMCCLMFLLLNCFLFFDIIGRLEWFQYLSDFNLSIFLDHIMLRILTLRQFVNIIRAIILYVIEPFL